MQEAQGLAGEGNADAWRQGFQSASVNPGGWTHKSMPSLLLFYSHAISLLERLTPFNRLTLPCADLDQGTTNPYGGPWTRGSDLCTPLNPRLLSVRQKEVAPKVAA
ncbi:hypothetical protein Bbelb_207020 [Branchiostoma belcheri]|nr:hypothetical protein Bbelb_207020 [Branchiostoma belcheri]